MDIGTGIAIAGVWIYAGVAIQARNISELGIKKSVRRAWIVTFLVMAFELIHLLK